MWAQNILHFIMIPVSTLEKVTLEFFSYQTLVLSLDSKQILQCPACVFDLYQLISLYPIEVQTVNNSTHKKEWSIEECTRPRSLGGTAVKCIISDQQNIKLLVIQTAVLAMMHQRLS